MKKSENRPPSQKADSLKEVSINQAKADNESNTAEIESQTEIAKRENELAIKRAELKTEEDKAKARADATYDIESQRVRKDLEKATQEAEIAKREKRNRTAGQGSRSHRKEIRC